MQVPEIKKAIVTGGGGFVGKAIVRRLIAQGIETAIISRNRYPDVEDLGAQVLVGDIRDRHQLCSAFRGFDTVFHVAAKAGIWGAREEYFSINATGTENVISACRQNNIPRLVYTSTPSVVFRRRSLENVSEDAPYAESFLCHYAASKAEAEKSILAADSPQLKTTALRPHLIWGPGDNHLLPRIIERGEKGQLRIVGDGKNLVDISYIDNVAEAHVMAARNLAAEASAAGKAYFISQGTPVNLWGWINELFKNLSIPPVTKRISFKTAYTAGTLLEMLYRVSHVRREPRMTRFLAEQLSKSHWFSIDRARNDFGYAPTVSTEEGMKRVVSWIRERNSLQTNG